MNVLFLTLLDFSTIEENDIYTDLIRQFVKDNHKMYIISPTEKWKQEPTRLIDNGNHKILKLQIGNTQKNRFIEKGISTVTLDFIFRRGIKKYYSKVRFDLIIYSTPPITLHKAVTYVKKRDNSKTYLLLKDIFPQNALDIGIMKKTGVKRFIYHYFRVKEKKLYQISDHIGCMSQANVEYLLKNNTEISPDVVEICPNSMEPITINKDINIIRKIRKKYNIPMDKLVLIYGGNLGKPQGIDFILKCLKDNKSNEHIYFVISGSGTEFNKIKTFFDIEKPNNALLLNKLPKADYDILVSSCDIGLIFLDKRFTIPNFPSRLLSYMQASIPVLAATDVNTDIGWIIENGKFGLWCESNDTREFNKNMLQLCDVKLRKQMGANARKYFEDHYTSKHSYEIIIKHC